MNINYIYKYFVYFITYYTLEVKLSVVYIRISYFVFANCNFYVYDYRHR